MTDQPATKSRKPQMHPFYHTTEEAWQLFLVKLRYRESKLITLSRNKPFLLEGDSVWLVYKGVVDVFSVRMENGKAFGAHHHFFRAYTDHLLMGRNLKDRTVGLLASCAPDTQLLQFSRAKLKELASQPEHTAIIMSMIEQWIVLLSSGIAVSVLPKDYQLLDGQKEVVLNTGEVVRASKDVYWVRHIEGSSRYNSRQDIKSLSEASLVPVSYYGWLETISPTRLKVFTTESALEADPQWLCIDDFYDLVLTCAALEVDYNLKNETHLIQERIALDQARIETVYTSLASTWSDTPLPGLSSTDSNDPLIVASRIIGQSLGITIVVPPDLSASSVQTNTRRLQNPVAEIAKASRVRVRQVMLQGNWWRSDNGPLLAYRGEDRHPVALLPRNDGGYELHDSVRQKTAPVDAAVAAELDKRAFMFYRPLPDRLLTAFDLLRFGLQGIRQDAAVLLTVGIAIGILGMILPLLTGAIFDSILPAGQRGQLLLIYGVLLVSAGATALFQMARSLTLMRIEGKMSSSLQAAIWDRLLNLPVEFFRKYPAGDLTKRAMGINQIKDMMSGTVALSLLSGIFSVFNFLLLFYFDASLALVASAIVISQIIVTVILGQLLLRHQRQVVQIQGDISGLIAQLVSGIVKLRVAGAEARAFSLWGEKFSQQKKMAFKARTIQNYLVVFIAVYPLIASMALFAVMYSRIGLTTGKFLAFNAAFTLFLSAGLQLSIAFITVLSAVPIYERLKPILQTPPEVSEEKSNPGELSGAIEISHVSFRYRHDGPLILDDLTFSIKRGEFIALVGASGSGKSTLMRILLGFEMPVSGAVYYDGQAVTELDMRAVRRQIGVVLQHSQVMTGEIFTNIVGATNLTVDDAWEAARLSGIEETIKELPMGMHTYISEGGSTFSGGQKQRLLIARALVTRPRIIFFDEATSALDDKSQAAVTESLKHLQATRIIIAHRLKTVVDADRILVLDQGKIAESGTYDELVNLGGRFANLIQRQLV